MAFPGTERVAYERERVFPLAGLERGQAERYYRVMELQKELAYAGSEAARRYLNGEAHSAAAERWLTPYALMEPAQARQRIRFLDTYRSYVINYNLGEDLVREYVERSGVRLAAIVTLRGGRTSSTPPSGPPPGRPVPGLRDRAPGLDPPRAFPRASAPRQREDPTAR